MSDATTSNMATSIAIDIVPLILRTSAWPFSAPILLISSVLLFIYAVFRSQKAVSFLHVHILQYFTFFYSSFLKPHSEDGGSGQQAALESFYKVQVAHMKDRYDFGLC